MATILINGWDGPDYEIEAQHETELFTTDPAETVAWDGTAAIYRDSQNFPILEWHSGNGAHPVQYKRITEREARTMLLLSESGQREELREYVFLCSVY